MTAKRLGVAAALTVLAACSAPSKAPAGPDLPGAGSAGSPAPGSPGPSGAATPAPADDAAAQEARLAAIQHAMNELDEGAQLCWAAAAAVDGYQLAGELAFTIDIGAGGGASPPAARVSLARDNTKAPRLTTCLQKLLAEYSWAPPLYGQALQLPFKFRAPDGQNVIDRRLVPFVAQGKVSVAVLLDEQNSGNDKVSMFGLHLEAGATTEMRQAPRAEAWVFLGAASVVDSRGVKTEVVAGDVMLVPASGLRQVTAPKGAELSAIVAITPGGEEGSARLGALPTPLAQLPGAQRKAIEPAVIVRAADAQRLLRPSGSVSLILDPVRTRRNELSAAMLTLEAGAAVPLHDHARETELLYVFEGGGTMTVDGVSLEVTPTSVVQVPPGAKHSFTASARLRAIQLYAPGGPEQRFKTPPAASPKAP